MYIPILQVARDAGMHYPVRAKKLFVLAALEVDRSRRRLLEQSLAATTTAASPTNQSGSAAAPGGTMAAAHLSTMATMNALMQHDSATGVLACVIH